MRKEQLKTPCFVVREEGLRRNLEILKEVRMETGCRILLAQKAFSMYRVYPLIGQYLDGTTASGLYEAKLDTRRWERRTISSPRRIRKRRCRRSLSCAGISCLTPRRR